MDLQYYKKLVFAILGIYSVYLCFGLVQEKMYSVFLVYYEVIDMLAQMESVSTTHLFCFSSKLLSIIP